MRVQADNLQMRLIFLFIGALVFSVGAYAAKQPNIVLIMADDMGFSDIGCYQRILGSSIDAKHQGHRQNIEDPEHRDVREAKHDLYGCPCPRFHV